MKRFAVKIVGITPLLMNRISNETLEGVRRKERKKFVAPKDPREEAEKKVYRTNDGAFFWPTENMMACLVAAGIYIKLDGKRQMTTSKSTLLPGFMSVEDSYLRFVSDGWDVDMRPGRNPNGGEMVCLVRPRFNKWEIPMTILIDDEQISPDRIRELFDRAGSNLGLGDFRPQRKGIYGRFRVDEWKEAA